MELQPADPHVGRRAQALAGRLPGPAVVGRLVDAVVEHAGVERAATGRALRVQHDRNGRPPRGRPLGRRLPGGAEIGAQADAAREIRAMAAVDDVAVGDVVDVGEGAPDLARRLRVEGQLVAGVAPGGPALAVPPYPSLARVQRAGEADVGVGDVMPLGLERIDVVVPGRGDHQAVAQPGGSVAAARRAWPHFQALPPSVV